MSYPVDEIDDGIDDREREEHDDEADDREPESGFRFLDAFGISESGSIEKRSEYDTADGEYRTDEYELVGDARDFRLHALCYGIVIRCYGALRITALEVFRDIPAAVVRDSLGTVSCEYRRE